MKKVFSSLAAALLLSATSCYAASIWSNPEAHHVTWSTTLLIPAEQFTTASAGNLLTLSLQNATDVIELKANGQKLPGTCYATIADATKHEVYLTEAMLDSCKTYGLEICGASFDVTDVDLADGKAGNLEAGKTIWTGYFWVDSWNTLELFKEALSAEDLSLYKSIRFYHGAAANSFLINLKANWDEAGNIASLTPAGDNSGSALQYGEGYVELDLTKVNPLSVINSVGSDRLLIQGNKEAGEAFNLTDIVLVPGTSTAVETTTTTVAEGIYDLFGRRLERIEQGGIYIVNGKKVVVAQ